MGSKVVLHMEAFKAFRQSTEVQDEVNHVAEQIASRANQMAAEKGCEYTVAAARTVAHGTVALVTGNRAAQFDTRKHNTLLKALGGSS